MCFESVDDYKVLILVLMEYALRASENPVISEVESLNPCFNGICSASKMEKELVGFLKVLILVLMEYALRVIGTANTPFVAFVLILVLMEYALREFYEDFLRDRSQGLNPCFNGICSASL